MKPTSPGELTSVSSGGPELDGIVFDTPSHSKVVVAIVDRTRGPELRTVHPRTLSERSQEGPSDAVLRRLIRRTPAPAPGAGSGAPGAGRGSSGHKRAAMHRTTGR